ncbi:MAG: TRAP transporter substrate-binding protein DctP [Gammaproteobacteria bacterium]|nr:TRAP transporter substrate-binding protein DctP [Gammaproteobacteria bacterium]
MTGKTTSRRARKKLAIDLLGITFWENGFKQFTANTPLTSPEAFADKRIRVMKSRLLTEQFALLGATAIPIDFYETRQALADGAVDGQENPLVAIAQMKFHEVQSHLTLSDHAWLGYVLSASKKVFSRVPPTIYELIKNSAQQLNQWEREETARLEAQLLAEISATGTQIITLDATQHAQFAAKLAPLADSLAMEIGYDILAKTVEMRLPASLAATPPPILIGLDAELSGSAKEAGGAIYRGAELAIEAINSAGGVLGRPIQLVGRDHFFNAGLAINNIKWMATHPDLVAIIGGLHSMIIIQELATIHELQRPYLVPWAAASGVTANGYHPNFIFRLSLRDSEVTPFLIQRALAEAGTGRIVLMLERSDWGRSNEEAAAELTRVYGDRLLVEWVNRGESQFLSRLQKLQAAGVTAMVMATNFVESSYLVNAIAKLDKPFPVFAHWGITGGDFWGANRADLAKIDFRFVQSVIPDHHSSLALQAMQQHYRQKYSLPADAPLPAFTGTVHSYELVQLLARAITAAGTVNGEAIQVALENIDTHDGLLRYYSPPFSATEHDVIGGLPLLLARYNSDGKVIQADP